VATGGNVRTKLEKGQPLCTAKAECTVRAEIFEIGLQPLAKYCCSVRVII
jgi:hypothetical protein